MVKSSTKKIHNDYEDREGVFGLGAEQTKAQV